MRTILHIDASIRGEDSVSRGLSAKLVESLTHLSGARVIRRDLADNDLPLIDGVRFAANIAPALERSDEQVRLAAIGDTLIEELQQADTIVMGLPMYNFTMSSTLKAWADLVARAGTTFRYTESGPEGLLTGKKAYVLVATGGTPIGSEIDFLTPWLKHFLGFIGIHDVSIVAADGIMSVDGPEKIEQAHRSVELLAA